MSFFHCISSNSKMVWKTTRSEHVFSALWVLPIFRSTTSVMVVGSQTAFLSCDVQADTCADLRLANLAICIPGIESQMFEDIMTFWDPECIPVTTRDPSKDTKFLPKYLVPPNSALKACIRIFKNQHSAMRYVLKSWTSGMVCSSAILISELCSFYLL